MPGMLDGLLSGFPRAALCLPWIHTIVIFGTIGPLLATFSALAFGVLTLLFFCFGREQLKKQRRLFGLGLMLISVFSAYIALIFALATFPEQCMKNL